MPRRALLLLVLAAVASAGCLGAGREALRDPAGGAGAGAEDGFLVTDIIEGAVGASLATPVRTVNAGGGFSYTFATEPAVSGYIVEVAWAAASPASERLSVWLRPAGAGAPEPTDPAAFLGPGANVGQAEGPSPLRIALPREALPQDGDYDIVVRAMAAPVGAAAAQPFTIYLTNFYRLPFDAGYSALAAGDGR